MSKEGLLGYYEYQIPHEILDELAKIKFENWVFTFKKHINTINKEMQYVGVGRIILIFR
jgi:hypothetical protein